MAGAVHRAFWIAWAPLGRVWPSTDFVAGAALGEPGEQISWQVQYFVSLECRFRSHRLHQQASIDTDTPKLNRHCPTNRPRTFASSLQKQGVLTWTVLLKSLWFEDTPMSGVSWVGCGNGKGLLTRECVDRLHGGRLLFSAEFCHCVASCFWRWVWCSCVALQARSLSQDQALCAKTNFHPPKNLQLGPAAGCRQYGGR